MKNFIPKGLTRFGGRTALKLSSHSPTIMVVAGVVGLGATAVLAAKASRQMDPIIEDHQKGRVDISGTVYETKREEQKDLVRLYSRTTKDLARLYGPTLVVGTLSTASVLYGHKVLHGRHVASIAAYSGLMEQFTSYRGRVAKTLGSNVERGIYEGAHGEWVEDPDHKGEHKLAPKFDADMVEDSYLRPWFDESNVNWTRDPVMNYTFLKGVQTHMNNILQIRGHVTLNDVYDALRIPRTNEGQVAGWVWNSGVGDNFIDFGFMSGIDPHTVAFRNQAERTVRLNFNVQGNIYGMI